MKLDVLISSNLPLIHAPRLRSPENANVLVNSYTRRARVQIIHKAAAAAWAEGVPWAEALQIAEKAIKSADAKVPALKFSAKGRGKAKGAGKGKAKGKR